MIVMPKVKHDKIKITLKYIDPWHDKSGYMSVINRLKYFSKVNPTFLID